MDANLKYPLKQVHFDWHRQKLLPLMELGSLVVTVGPELGPPLPESLGSPSGWVGVVGLAPDMVTTRTPTGQVNALSLLPCPPHNSFQKPILEH